MAEDIVKKNGRVLYVEPNDIYGSVNGYPLTPEYENYCIGFNLVAECVSRYKPNLVHFTGNSDTSGNDGTTCYSLSWTSSVNDGSSNCVTFMKGNGKSGGQTFLTTYYTDITFDNVKKGDIVEGLGVESVTISFESYYMPVIVIKFVDVRGSALFAREDAIHDTSGKVTADNVFGCFMTLPYPKFRLQVKGFYGKPVTYQLTVSNFQGNFNPNDGNFEITVKFISYSYALLSDIPIMYLVAAPFCEYVGKSYWEKKSVTEEWALDNGTAPPTLFSLIKTIDARKLKVENTSRISEEHSNKLKAYSTKNEMLNNIQSSLNDFIYELEKNTRNKRCYIYPDNSMDPDSKYKDYKQLLCMYDSVDSGGKRQFTDMEIFRQQAVCNAINSYKSQYGDSDMTVPGIFNSSYLSSECVDIKDCVSITERNDGTREVTLSCVDTCETERIMEELELNGETLVYSVAKELHDLIEDGDKNSILARYFVLFNFGDLEKQISERKSAIEIEEKKIKEMANADTEKEILKVLDFTPNIGNIFKILMCHLDTLCHIISQSVIDIDGNSKDRTPSSLGIEIGSTDAIGVETIPAWPGMYNNGSKEGNGGFISQIDNTLAWPGDFNGEFVEENVVNSLMDAIMMINRSATTEKASISAITSFPVLPCDLNSSVSPFYDVQDTSLSSLGGYVGIRLAQIFGVMFNGETPSGEIIEQMARMDAYNFFMIIGDRNLLMTDVIRPVGGSSLSDALKYIALCDSSGDQYGNFDQGTDKSYHVFETNRLKDEYNSNKRCPILMEDGSEYKFVRYYDKDDISLVPSRMKEWSGYSDIFSYVNDGSDKYFSPSFSADTGIYSANEFLHVSNSSSVIDDSGRIDNYVNDDLFNIVTDGSEVDDIVGLYDRLSSDEVSVILGDYEGSDNFSGFMDKVWLLDDKDYAEYYSGSVNIFSQDNETFGIDNESLLGGDDMLINPDWYDTFTKKTVQYKEGGTWVVNSTSTSYDGTTDDGSETVSVNDLYVKQTNIYQDGVAYSLFGHPLYYIQNEISDVNVRNRSKCLLFLSTLGFNLSKIPNFLSVSKTCGTVEAVPYGYLLLLGGTLWRSRYYVEHGNSDPIMTVSGSVIGYQGSVGSFLPSLSSGSYILRAANNGTSGSVYTFCLGDVFGDCSVSDIPIDYHVENKLIYLFESFVESDFMVISNNCEITSPDGNFTGSSFYNFLKEYSDFVNDDDLSSDDYLDFINDNAPKLSRKYGMIHVGLNNPVAAQLMLMEDNAAQDVIKDLYVKKCVVLDTGGKRLAKTGAEDTQVTFNMGAAGTYIDAFANELEDIANGAAQSSSNSNKENGDRELRISMYYYIKNLYDRWLLSSSADEYDVDKFFKENFVFIDKFYINTYSLVMLNCGILSELYHSRIGNSKSSLFSFIGDIVSRHNCLFVALPDFVDFGGNETDRINAMKDLFMPLSFNDGMTAMRENNHFVIIYVGEISSSATELNNYRSDSFDIRPGEDKDISMLFGSGQEDDSTADLYERYGYGVPAFGVSFARQNQQIFKNISVNMDNPMATDISISAMYGIAKEGSGNTGGVVYYGQDIFNIYRSYAYECEVEMMGNAQIQPLMYFQLLNVPMWSGAYMVFNVTHTMSPGNMVTRIRGQKMSRYYTPYLTRYLSKKKDMESMENVSQSGDGSSIVGTSSGEKDYDMRDSYIGVSDSEVSCDLDYLKDNYVSGDTVNFEYDGVQLREELCVLLSRLVKEVETFSGNKWTVLVSSAVRSYGNSSEHNYKATPYPANAVDLQVAEIRNGKKVKVKDASKVFYVMDILVTNHRDEIGQLIFEGMEGHNILNGDLSYMEYYNCLHLSYTGNIEGAPQIFMSDDANGKNIANGNRYEVSYLSDNVPAGYKSIAKKVYKSGNDDNSFRRMFPFYYRFSSDELKEHFGESRNSAPRSSAVNC